MYRLLVVLTTVILLLAASPLVGAQSPTRPAAPQPTATTPRPPPPPVAPTPTPARPALTPTPTLPGQAPTKVGATPPGQAPPAPTPTRLPPSPTATRTPAPPAPAPPGTVAGIPYDPAKDTTGARERVEAYRDEQLRNGVPQADAERIARAHFLWDCREAAKNCEQTGFDFTGVDVNDAHANFGYNPECETWGVDFTPWWGQWDPPADQPNCDASGGGNNGGGGLPNPFGRLPSANDIANAVVRALDLGQFVGRLLEAVYKALVVGGIDGLAASGATILTRQPDLTSDRGGMRNIQDLVRALQAAAVGLCTVMLTFTALQFWQGRAGDVGDVLGRLVVSMFCLGFYQPLVGWGVRLSNDLTAGILTAGGDGGSTALPQLLASLLPLNVPLFFLLGIIGALLIVWIAVVKMIGFALLIVLYYAGPLLIPLAINRAGGRWVNLWLEHAAKALLWPVVWALELKVAAALLTGLSLTDGGGLALTESALGACAAFGMLCIIAATPATLHFKVNLAGAAQAVADQGVRAANSAAVFVSGGTAATATVYAARQITGRRKGGSQ